MSHVTHETLDPRTPFVAVNPFETDAGSCDALRIGLPVLDAARFAAPTTG
jgi:hypothetical protein